MALSMSISSGRIGGKRHNVRSEYRMGLKNVDAERTPMNVILTDESIEDAYRMLFQPSVDEYNESQIGKGHPERQIGDYLDKIREDKQKKPSYEMVVQIGNMETNPATDEKCRAVSEAVYRRFLERWQQAFPHMHVVTAAIHMDEATPHLHVEYVPWTDAVKRGLRVQNSLTSALKQDGFATTADASKEAFAILEEVAKEYGIERVDMGCKRPHLDVETFKRVMREQEQGVYQLPDDVKHVLAQAYEIAEQYEQLEEFAGALVDGIEKMASKVGVINSPRTVAELNELSEGYRAEWLRRTGRSGIVGAFKEAMDTVKALWTDYVVNPVSDRLRAEDVRTQRAGR